MTRRDNVEAAMSPLALAAVFLFEFAAGLNQELLSDLADRESRVGGRVIEFEVLVQLTVPHYLRSDWVVKAETNRAVMLCAASRGHTAAALLRPRLVAALAASAKVAVAGDDVDLTRMCNIGTHGRAPTP